jgi:hypothetical protein
MRHRGDSDGREEKGENEMGTRSGFGSHKRPVAVVNHKQFESSVAEVKGKPFTRCCGRSKQRELKQLELNFLRAAIDSQKKKSPSVDWSVGA